eukprot:CAMPEP_0184646856 /NCGR_PEP_ID=MMETSP0308-20130426/3652_1 /TAXON_ID=38269 /ORGANISM="Gloeochaete witrockiana, Strain SAG 46.84" /LENGTH=33 /DNA_ID= /DNA_START= /DNA_END= /DNA_ORIENTATION=
MAWFKLWGKVLYGSDLLAAHTRLPSGYAAASAT